MHSQVSWSAGGCRLFEPQKTDRLYPIVNERQHNNNMFILVIPQKSTRPREAGWLDERTPEILRAAQDDITPGCHPEQREGSLADFWGITRFIHKLDVTMRLRELCE